MEVGRGAMVSSFGVALGEDGPPAGLQHQARAAVDVAARFRTSLGDERPVAWARVWLADDGHCSSRQGADTFFSAKDELGRANLEQLDRARLAVSHPPPQTESWRQGRQPSDEQSRG
jgi:hypothetical protein